MEKLCINKVILSYLYIVLHNQLRTFEVGGGGGGGTDAKWAVTY